MNHRTTPRVEPLERKDKVSWHNLRNRSLPALYSALWRWPVWLLRDWHNDRGWAERGYGPGYGEGYRHDWRPVEVEGAGYGPGYYEGYRPDWRPVHYVDRGYGHVVYVHGHDRRW